MLTESSKSCPSCLSINLELYKFRYYDNDVFVLENVKEEEEKTNKYQAGERKSDVSVTETKVLNLEYHLSKGQEHIRELFLTLRERILEMDENIQERINNNYVGFKVSKMFAEVHIQRNKLMLYLRPIDYNDPGRRVFKVPDSYNWVLDRRIYVENNDDLVYVMPLIEQSYKDVL